MVNRYKAQIVFFTAVWKVMLSGGIAGCCFWSSMYPFDVIKARIQVILYFVEISSNLLTGKERAIWIFL